MIYKLLLTSLIRCLIPMGNKLAVNNNGKTLVQVRHTTELQTHYNHDAM